MRKGFGLITAIMFIVLVATLSALAISFASQSSKQSTDVYLTAQAELLAYSATEFALLAISGHDRVTNNDCVNRIEIKNVMGGFHIEIFMQYIGIREAAGGQLPDSDVACRKLEDGGGAANNIATLDSDVTVLMDTIVTLPSDRPDVPCNPAVENCSNLGNTEQIRIHRRTLQKP